MSLRGMFPLPISVYDFDHLIAATTGFSKHKAIQEQERLKQELQEMKARNEELGMQMKENDENFRKDFYGL